MLLKIKRSLIAARFKEEKYQQTQPSQLSLPRFKIRLQVDRLLTILQTTTSPVKTNGKSQDSLVRDGIFRDILTESSHDLHHKTKLRTARLTRARVRFAGIVRVNARFGRSTRHEAVQSTITSLPSVLSENTHKCVEFTLPNSVRHY